MERVLVTACAVIATAVLAAAPLATARPLTMRYCQRPDLAGAYIQATPNVNCGTALAVPQAVTRRGCWNTNQCDVRGFVCVAYWSGSFRRPFSFTHHGICVASGQRRIEFDLS
jgi:hypothetical protein